MVFWFILVIVMSCKNNDNNQDNTSRSKVSIKIQQSKITDSISVLEEEFINNSIDFYAIAPDSLWSLYMDFERAFHFKTLDGDEIYVPAVKGDKAKDANFTRFYAEVEKGELLITIQKQECQDTTTNQSFDFSVHVKFKYASENEFKEFFGCGTYLQDITLHNIWVLDKVNDKTILTNNNHERPRFEFFSNKGQVLGNTGCNNFKGNFSIVDYKVVQFSNMTIATNTCNDMNVEHVLNETVFGKSMKYSREDTFLHLSGYDGTELIFKKMD